MQCTNWRIISALRASSRITRRAAAAALAALIAGAPDAGRAAAARVTVIDDADDGNALLGRFDYIGSWQHVHGKRDGRSNGTSTRSTHAGDVAILSFTGTRIRIFGVRGPSGGRAGIALDERSAGAPVDFYAPHIQPHALIYQSPPLTGGLHTITIAVWGTRNLRGHYYYVNIDGAEVESPAPVPDHR